VREVGFRGACGGAGIAHRLASPYRLRRLQLGAGVGREGIQGMLTGGGSWSLQVPFDAIQRALDLRNWQPKLRTGGECAA